MRFHFFHNWNKWSVQTTYETKVTDIGRNTVGYELVTVQSRTCQTCGYTQIKTITIEL